MEIRVGLHAECTGCGARVDDVEDVDAYEPASGPSVSGATFATSPDACDGCGGFDRVVLVAIDEG